MNGSIHFVPATGSDCFAPIRECLLPLILQPAVAERLRRILEEGEDIAVFSPEDGRSFAREIGRVFQLASAEAGALLDVADGQCFRLNLLQLLVDASGDVDVSLVPALREGVRTGVQTPIPPSGVWRQIKTDDADDVAFHIQEGNWSSAEDNQQLTDDLLKKELAAGHMVRVAGGLDEARRRWGQFVAVGKLGVITAPGKEPRLVGDSTISGANPAAMISEKAENPTVTGVAAAMTQAGWEADGCTAFSLDVKGAHKLVSLHESEWGLNIFFSATLGYLAYRVCHFGGRWSAYWWSRVGGLLLRLCKQLVGVEHLSALYVDDFLFIFKALQAPELSLLVLALLAALGVPLSWKKLQFGNAVSWLGFVVHLKGGAFCQ